MIKAKLIHKGQPILIFGLSEGNIARLRKKQPIKFDLAELGIEPSIPVLIIAGKDEESMRAELAEWFEMPKGEKE